MSLVSEAKKTCKKGKKDKAKDRSNSCKRQAGGTVGGKTSCKDDDKINCCKKKSRNKTKESKKECTLKKGAITIKINCDNYKFHQLPAPKVTCLTSLSKWKVRTATKKGVAGTDRKLEFFQKRLEIRKLNAKETKLLQDTLTIKGLSTFAPPAGEQRQKDDFILTYKKPSGKVIAELVIERIRYINATIYEGRDTHRKLNIHHLRPVWAGGSDNARNFWVAPSRHKKPRSWGNMAQHKTLASLRKGSTGEHDNIHDWWSYNIFWELNEMLDKKHKCYLNLDPLPEIDLNDDYIGAYTENNITNISDKFNKVGKSLYLKFTCPAYCTDWKI